MRYLVFAIDGVTFSNLQHVLHSAGVRIVNVMPRLRVLVLECPPSGVTAELKRLGATVVEAGTRKSRPTRPSMSSCDAPDVFLCHSSKDKAFVRRLARDLAELSVYAWFDEWALAPGDSLHGTIGDALEKSAIVAVVVSPNSIRSHWCAKELRQALSRESRAGKNVVIPLRYKRVQMPPFLEDKLYIDFSTSYWQPLGSLAGLVHDLNQRSVSEALSTLPKSIHEVKAALRQAGWNSHIPMHRDLYDQIRELFRLHDIQIPHDAFRIIADDETTRHVAR